MKADKNKYWNKEKTFKKLFYFQDKLQELSKIVTSFCRFSLSITVFLFVVTFIYFIGYSYTVQISEKLKHIFQVFLLILTISKFLPELISIEYKGILSTIFRVSLFFFTLTVLFSNFPDNSQKDVSEALRGNVPVISAIILICISEISRLFDFISNVNIPPSLVFSGSFFIIIIIGAGLLMLPNSHTVPLSLIDSVFTSASAVCVTGLVVVDTAGAFTDLGKLILLGLIQIGGLGIMTFTGFFSYMFTSKSTLHQRLLLKDIFSAQSMGNLFKILSKIIIFAFLTEIVGTLLIFASLDQEFDNKILFSVFHSVSAFCNAGFSTLSDGLLSPGLKDNYTMQGTIAFLIILGGIGFPVLLKIYSFFKHLFLLSIRKIRGKRLPLFRERLDVSTRIALWTTLILIVAGTAFYIIFEKEKSMVGMRDFKLVFTAFFNSVTARTAGFSVNNFANYGYPAVFLTIVLMWIGASPGSTGGGVKTTTIAIALKSAWSNIRGKEFLEISGRVISSGTISRVLSIIILSLIVISTGFICLLVFEPDKNPVHLLYESVSAFSTVGLSIAGTSTFSESGKIVLIFLMFIGRVGPITLLTGFFISDRKKYYTYPGTEIVIN